MALIVRTDAGEIGKPRELAVAIGKTARAGAGDRFHHALRHRDAPHGVVAMFGDEKIARRVHHDAIRIIEAGVGADAVNVAGIAHDPVGASGHGGHQAIGVDFADAITGPFGQEQITLAIHGHAAGLVEPRVGPDPILVTASPVACVSAHQGSIGG